MASGRQGSIGLGKETTFGTAVPPTIFFNGTESLSEERGRLREPITFGSRELQPADAGRLRISGSIDGIHARPANLGHLLRAALGAPTTTGAGPYTHVFTPSKAKFSDAAALPPYTITVKRNSGVIHRYSGGQLNTLTLNQPADNALSINTAWIAQGVANVADTLLVQEQNPRFRFAQLEVTRAGTPFTLLESVGFTITNNLEVEELLDGTYVIAGTDFGDSQISLNLTATFRDSLSYADFVANTTAAWTFKWTIDPDTTLEIKIPRLNIDSWGAPISGPGRMSVSCTGQAEFDAVAGHGLEIELVNNTPSY